jgi:branched-chain amino acid transport system ATP-binding protein
VSEPAILAVRDVHKRFGGLHAVRGASFDVAEGSITALIGPNGAGKTTLFNVLTGFYRSDSGSIVFDGGDVSRKPPHRIATRGMVRTFQITKALAAMPVIDNMMLAAPDQPGEKLRGYALRPRRALTREREVRAQALELLEGFDLAKLADEYAGALSGGQRKLLELARAIMAEPRLLMLDEPMAGVNPTLAARLLEHMRRLRAERGTTFLFVEHDMEMVMSSSDRVVVMAEGEVIASGPPQEVRADEHVVEVYLGGGHQVDLDEVGASPRAARASSAKVDARRARVVGSAGVDDSRQTAAADVVLATEDLVAGYLPDVDILNGVSIAVRAGELVTVIGPNGAGKSTLLKTIFGLLKARRGRVLLEGEDIASRPPHDITRSGVAYVPQLDNVFQSLTVEENLEVGAVGVASKPARIQEMYELFPRLGERRRQTAGTMSGGERQMLAMARALMPAPKLLLLDEPSAGLAPAFVEATFEQIELVNASGVTVVMVEQNARRALSMSQRGYVLDLGVERFEGSGRELLEDPKVADLYLGGTKRADRGQAVAPEVPEQA